jgi:hypothetical protein
MDFTQSKLSKKEWESIEAKVSIEEHNILKMINSGYNNININQNKHNSIINYLKMDESDNIHNILYNNYFKQDIEKNIKKYGNFEFELQTNKLIKLTSIDRIRIDNLSENISKNKDKIFEFLLIELCYNILKYHHKQKSSYVSYLYSLIHLMKCSINKININVLSYVNKVIDTYSKDISTDHILKNANLYIEKNEYIMKYQDLKLFSHQKEIYSVCKINHDNPKLIQYCAPTGTGKTLTPIGLSNQYKIIFVCVARHIGLSLAKSAINMDKKVAFAFGCKTSSDIRLHYNAVKEFEKNYKTGGIFKADNSVGDKVDIIICDVMSYLISMNYMMAFNCKSDILTFWDEPTISMDSENHELHDIIHKNWVENEIPNMVLSCATLPHNDEIQSVIQDFRGKFDNSRIFNINSYDYKKSIPILNKQNYCVLIHNMYENYDDMINCVNYCNENKTLLRYFDLQKVVEFIYMVQKKNILEDDMNVEVYFEGAISNITMNTIKQYYLDILKLIPKEEWRNLYNIMKQYESPKFGDIITRTTSIDSINNSNNLNNNLELKRTYSVFNEKPTKKPKVSNSGVLFTTQDAHTLTDGPTIYLCDDVNKIGKFYLQQSNIPNPEFQKLLTKITKNNEITDKIQNLEKLIENEMEKNEEGDNGTEKVQKEKMNNECRQMVAQINKLRKQVLLISLDYKYIPNSRHHQNLWLGDDFVENAFTPHIEEHQVKQILLLKIDNYLKVLLLMGIGILMDNVEPDYIEIMKSLAQNQKLYIIIASSDYIYGTNYQFCHGIIGKDLTNMTQQKTIQSLGRVGRGNIQQTYTVRFRDDNMIKKLFEKQEYNLEAINMNKLFSSE